MQNSLPKRIHDDRNELDYILQGDYYFPVIDDPSETRPIGRWGRMHKKYLEENRPALYNQLLLKGTINTYLADLNERAVNLGRHKPSGIYTRYTSSMAETGLRFDKESYDAGYGDILFRGRKLMAIRNAKRFLKEMYGDFEQLPPEEKRIPEHPINMMESAERCIRRYN